MGLAVDWSISLGNLLTIGGMLAGGFWFAAAVRRDVDVLSERLKPLENAIIKLTDILVQLGRQSERLAAVERDLERNDPRKQWRQPGAG